MKKHTHEDVLLANREYYDKVGNDYRENEQYAYSKDIIDDVTRIIRHYSAFLDERKMFLDFGCGSGFLSEVIFNGKIFKYAMGIDISKVQIDLYNKKFDNRKFRGLTGDITNLPYRDNTFDMVGSYSVLHHILDYKSVIKEVTRVLKHNGILYSDFEPNRGFRKLMSLPLSIRRRIFDKAPHNLDELEFLAEYHHNIEPGIDKDEFLNYLKNNYEIFDVGPRYPHFMFKQVLKFLFNFSWSFVPYFYVVARKL